MDDQDLINHVHDPARLEALRATALLDSPSEEAFDRLSRLAAVFLNVPVALVSLIDADRQFFKSCIGLPPPWDSLRQTPLSHSFCQHNRIVGRPLLIEDARLDPLLCENPAIWDLQAVAYLGVPLVTSDGYVIGSFCVIDSKPKKWLPSDVEIIEDLSAAVMTEIQLRTEIAARRQAEDERDDLATVNSRLQRQISARKIAEEQKRQLEAQLQHSRKMEAIGRLAGGIAHDLNNLLTPILGYGELLADEGDYSDRQKKFLREIHQSAQRAKNLVRQLLSFSRKQPLEFRPLDLNAVINDFTDFLQYFIADGVDLHITPAEVLKPIVADAGQVEQILMNLCLNGTQAMPKGGSLRIETASVVGKKSFNDEKHEKAAGEYSVLKVSDTGTGLEESIGDRIFEPFFSTKGKEGTGLGLATVYDIVKQHGGFIEVESEKDQGTTFALFFPVSDDPCIEENRAESGRTDVKGTETILLVEDNSAVRTLLRTILEDLGYQVHTVSDSSEALSVLNGSDSGVDLVLTNIVMPGMNGSEIFAEGLRRHPRMKALFMSGYMEETVTHREVLTKQTRFLQKPFSRADLASALRRLLDEKVE